MRQLVGLVVLLCLVVAGATLAWNEDVFASRPSIYLVTDSALRISKDVAMKVFGLTVGSVEDIEVLPKAVARDGAAAFERRRSLVDLPADMKRTFLGEEKAAATAAAPAAAAATP